MSSIDRGQKAASVKPRTNRTPPDATPAPTPSSPATAADVDRARAAGRLAARELFEAWVEAMLLGRGPSCRRNDDPLTLPQVEHLQRLCVHALSHLAAVEAAWADAADDVVSVYQIDHVEAERVGVTLKKTAELMRDVLKSVMIESGLLLSRGPWSMTNRPA